MLLLTGYNPLPRRRLDWENSSDVHNAVMSNAMSLNHFEEIFSILHLIGNMNLDKQDQMTKVRPFHDMISKHCIENQPNSPDLSVMSQCCLIILETEANSECKIWLLQNILDM